MRFHRKLMAMVLAVVLLAGCVPALAEGAPTNGLLLDMTLGDYIAAYEQALLSTAPPSPYLADAANSVYIDAATNVLKASLPSPSTTIINEADVYAIDPYGRFCVAFDVTETDALGAMTRTAYYLFATGVDAEGTVRYRDGIHLLKGDNADAIKKHMDANEFGVNPSEQAVALYRLDPEGFILDGALRIAPGEAYETYHYAGRGFTLRATAAAPSGQLAGVQLSIGEEALRSFPMAERKEFLTRCLAVVLAAAHGDADTQGSQAIIDTLFDTTRLNPTGETYYADAMLYGCFLDGGMLSFVAMPVADAVYQNQAYWWVNAPETYILAEAERLLLAGDLDGAIWRYEELGLTADTSQPLARAYYEKAAQAMEAGRTDDAIALYQSLGDYSDAMVQLLAAYYAKGDALYAAGQIQDARAYFLQAGSYEDALQRYQSCSYRLGEDALALKEYNAAAAYFTQADGYLDAKDKVLQSHYEFALQMIAAGRDDNAAEFFRPLGAEAREQLLAAYYAHAEALHAEGDIQQARRYYQQAEGYRDAADKYQLCGYQLGGQALATKDFDGAAAYFTEAGNYLDAKEKLLQTQYERAQALLDKQDYPGAAAAFTQAGGYADAEAKVLQTYAEYARQLIAAGKEADADAYFRPLGDKATEQLLAAYYAHAEALYEDGDIQQARTYYQRAGDYQDAAEKYQLCGYQLGEQALAKQDFDAAQAYFTEAGNYEGAKEKLLQTHYDRAQTLLDKKDYDAAAATFAQAAGYADAETKVLQAHYEHAMQLLEAGQEDDAIAYFQQAGDYADASDQAGAIFYRRGEAAFANGDYAAALERFQQAGSYSDSPARVEQILGIEDSQAYEQAMGLYQRYIADIEADTPGAEQSYAQARDAFLALAGSTDADAMVRKLGEVRALRQTLKEAQRTLTAGYAGSGFDIVGVTEDAGAPERIRFLSVSALTKTGGALSIEYPLDRSEFKLLARKLYSMSAKDEIVRATARQLVATFSGVLQDTAFERAYDSAVWTESGGVMTATLFAEGYTMTVAYKNARNDSLEYFFDLEISGTRNAY